MAYTITPYKRDGLGTVGTTGTSATVVNATARGFRNVAIGALISATGGNRTVIAKASETSITVSSTVDYDPAVTYEYTNPALTLTGIYHIKHTKSDKPNITPITGKDADYCYATIGNGAIRDIQISGWIRSSTIADVYNNIAILESLADGSQTRQGTCTFTEDVPPRTSYVYITSLNWQYTRDNPKQIEVTINMVECKNRGST